MAWAALTTILSMTWFEFPGRQEIKGREESKSVCKSATYFHFVSAHGQGALNRAIQVHRNLGIRCQGGKSPSWLNDFGHALHPRKRLVDGFRQLFFQVGQIHGLDCLLDFFRQAPGERTGCARLGTIIENFSL